MSINPRLSRLVALLLGPVVLPQGRRVRKMIPTLPDAAEPWTGAIAGGEPLSILVLGDSTAAGVGAATQEEALPGNLAREFSQQLDRGAIWRAIGENGATTRDIVERYLDIASEDSWDVVFVSLGANDALKIRSRAAFRRDYRTILRRLRAVSPNALILVATLPAFFRYSSLPNPLRWALDLHARNLDAAVRDLVRSEPGVIMSPPAPEYPEGFFATDLFHPSAIGYREWVRFTLTKAGLVREA